MAAKGNPIYETPIELGVSRIDDARDSRILRLLSLLVPRAKGLVFMVFEVNPTVDPNHAPRLVNAIRYDTAKSVLEIAGDGATEIEATLAVQIAEAIKFATVLESRDTARQDGQASRGRAS